MFSKIMTPVDLAHVGTLRRALQCAADQARLYDAEVVYVGVTATTPGSVAHTPEEFSARLAEFARTQADEFGIRATSQMVISHDPAAELDDALLGAVDQTGADLVVMASHVPGLLDYVWPSNGGKLAEHAKCSVLVVRG